MKTLERRHWRRFVVIIVNSEHISHVFLIVNFEQTNVSWVVCLFFLNVHLSIVMLSADYLNLFTIQLPMRQLFS